MQIVSRKLIRDIFGIHPDDGPASHDAIVFLMWLRLILCTFFMYGPPALVLLRGSEITNQFQEDPLFEMLREIWLICLFLVYLATLLMFILKKLERGGTTWRMLYGLSLFCLLCDLGMQAVVSHSTGILASQFTTTALTIVLLMRFILDYWHALMGLVLGVLLYSIIGYLEYSGSLTILAMDIHSSGAHLAYANESAFMFSLQSMAGIQLTAFMVVNYAVNRMRASEAERSRVFTRLMKNRARMLQQGRYSAMGHLIMGLNHELRNPMNRIFGGCEIATDITQQLLAAPQDIQSDTLVQLEKAIALISRGTNESMEKLKTIHGISSQETGTKEKLDLGYHLAELARMVERQRPSREAKISLEITDELWVVADAAEINQAVYLVLCNAYDFGNDPLQITLRAITADGQVLIEVEDNGPGITEEQKDALFDPFYTTRQSADPNQQMGLGLFLVQNIMHDHHGYAEITSTEKPFTVTLKLPSA